MKRICAVLAIALFMLTSNAQETTTKDKCCTKTMSAEEKAKCKAKCKAEGKKCTAESKTKGNKKGKSCCAK